MAIFVDLFMAAILLLALVLGIRQGFLQSLARVAIVIVALLGAAAFIVVKSRKHKSEQ